MRAIGYFNVDGSAANSSEELEASFGAYCRANRHQAVGCYVDGDGTGTPAFDRMLNEMRDSGETCLVVTPDATHLGRNLESVARVIVELEAMGAKVACMNREYPDPLQNAFHVLGVKGVSRARSAGIKQAMEARAMEGKALGRPLFGYRIGARGTLEPVPAEASVVELIYRLYTGEGLGLRLIAGHLNGRSIPTRSGKNWNVVTIRGILRNPAYTGTYNRFGITVSGSHEAIISRGIFNAAQARAKSRRPVGRVVSAEPFDLSGLVYCGKCGGKMMGATRRQSWKRKDGRRASGVYRYYQCQSRNNQSVCGYHTWRAPRLEASVLSQLRLALEARELREEDPQEIDRRLERVHELRQARLTNTERKLTLAQRRAAEGKIGMSVVGEYLKELDEARTAFEASIDNGGVLEKLERWDDLEPEERRRILQENVVRVDVAGDTAEVSV